MTNSALLRLLVVAAAGGTAVGLKCPVFNAATNFLDGAPCNDCTKNNAAALEGGDHELCAWCYDAATPEDSCVQYDFSLTGAFSNPCKTTAQPDAKFSIGGGDCDCSSPTYTTCAACTANAKCDWVESAQRNVDITVAGVALPTISFWQNETCLSGSALGPNTANFTLAASSGQMVISLTPHRWYCLQCTLSNYVFFAVVMTVTVVGIVLLAIAVCCCVRCCARKRRGPVSHVFTSTGNK